MEKDMTSREVVDLSQVLNEAEAAPEAPGEEAVRQEEMPGLYGLVGRVSGGKIKTQKQARLVLVVLIILMNILTLSLILRDPSGAGGSKVPVQVN
jgi:hypothetical protein